MTIQDVRRRAQLAAKNTNNFEVLSLANAVIGLCDLIESVQVLPPEIELKERVGS